LCAEILLNEAVVGGWDSLTLLRSCNDRLDLDQHRQRDMDEWVCMYLGATIHAEVAT
jgi:hypothetical protein